MAKLDDEVNQKKGIVVVVYMLKLKKDPITGYSSTCTALNFGKARIALPFRVGAIHSCVNDVASRAALAIVRNLPIMPKEERRRMRVHTGTLFVKIAYILTPLTPIISPKSPLCDRLCR